MRIYLEIDMLIDTRAGILRQHWPDIANSIIEDGYLERVKDYWPEYGISREEFRSKYESRNEETLTHSTITRMPALLTALADKHLERVKTLPIEPELIIDFNIWPFNLNSNAKEGFKEAISHYTKQLATVYVICEPISTFTIRSCKDRYEQMYIYDINGWITEHHMEFHATRAPDLDVIGPRLAQYQVDSPEMDIFAATELRMVESLRLHFQDIANYSHCPDFYSPSEQ